MSALAPLITIGEVGKTYRTTSGGAVKALESVSLEIQPQEFVVVVGPSGCGKTTLLRLIAGLYVPERGTVRVGQADPFRESGELLYLPQGPGLMNTTIMENLQAFSGGAPTRDILEAAAQTGLAEWVEQLPMKYETTVGPLGRCFSGGQAQLIALTGAIASPAAVLLLDEPLANLDGSYQRKVLGSRMLRRRTVVIVSHGDVAVETASDALENPHA
jgi:ABC-type bacteriocin/lantibiotic exporter with double-glycine peptidase domain